MIEGYDREQGYCRRVNQGWPCALARDCWFERFPVAEFLASHYTEEELARVIAPAPSRLSSILAAVRRAQEED